jgi:biotin operon repressor
MQLQAPIFPETTKMINGSFGLFSKEDFVYYLHNGSPIYCHSKEDRDSYRFILATIISNDLCSISELSHGLGINRKNIDRYVKALREKGMKYFFDREDNRGQCHKFTPAKQIEAQQFLDQGYSMQKTAKTIGLSEGAIRHHIKSGNLIKKKQQALP